MNNLVFYAKLQEDAIPPFRKHSSDAGMDFFSIEDAVVDPHSMKIIHTGITVQVPSHYMLLIKPKSRNNHLIGAGIIDSFYEPGEVLVKVVNISDNELIIHKGDAIAQGIYVPVETPILVEVDLTEIYSNSARSGSGGIVDQSKGNKA